MRLKGKTTWGKEYRAYQMNSNRNRHHKAVVKKLSIRDMCVEVRIIFYTDVEEDVFKMEIERIAYWRGLGVNLTNVLPGGESPSGWKHSEERKKEIGDSKRGNKYRLGAVLSEETRKKISKAHVGKTYSDEYKAAMVIACTGDKNGFFGKKHTAENRAKVAESNRRRVWTAESIAKRIKTLRENKAKKRSAEDAACGT